MGPRRGSQRKLEDLKLEKVSSIEQQFLTACLDEDSRTKAPSIRKWCAGTEKRYRDHVLGAGYPHVDKH
jgi:hypothetical protein